MNENIKDIYPLSPMQQGMLFHSLYAPETEVYSEQLSCKLHGKLEPEAFKKAWEAVTNHHDTLRSAFVWEDLDEPLQVVYEHIELPFEILDWQNKTKEEQETNFENILAAERKRGMELTEAPLMRILLIQLNEDTFRLIWNHHHLLLDGWGLPVILKEVMIFYQAFAAGKELRLPAPPPYSSYIAWLQEQDMEQAKQFWTGRLQGFSAPTPLSSGRFDESKSAGYGKERIVFSKEESDKLNDMAKESQVTLNTMVQGAWGLLLSRYSREDDVVFGGTVSGRPPELPGVETMLGLFINTLPIRVKIKKNQNVLEWLRELQYMQAETRQYEYTPLVDIQSWSDVPNNLPLFESILVFENYPVGEELEQKESVLELTDVRSFERTNFPITLVGAPGRQLALDIAYETNKFDKSSIGQMLKHLHVIINSFYQYPQQTLGQVPMLTPAEKERVLYTWNKTKSKLPDILTIHQLFEAQAAQNPELTAVSMADTDLTYRELNIKASQLAHFIRKHGAGPEKITGISLPRSFDMVIAALAVLKAGSAYIPIDPDYPEDRISHMIRDSGIELLITQSSLSAQFDNKNINILSIDKIQSEIEKESAANPENLNTPDSLAFVIYTSGSTGKPKGVLLHHRGAVNTLTNMVRDFQLKPGKNMLQFASFSFDAAAAEIFSSLISGASIQLVDRETMLSVDKMSDFLNSKDITTTTIPPSFLTMLPEEKINSFDDIVSVGDACSWELVSRWGKKCRFWNGYGPTEGTIAATWDTAAEYVSGAVTPPIGKPLGNVRIYILDEALNPVPVGVSGEIHIGGTGVARGYHNRPELTAEKFIPNPFSSEAGARMYKSGDLGRFMSDGKIEFMGRVDFQVKIRGFRIELGEIEAALLAEESVKDTVVLAREDTPGDKRLTAYIMPNGEQEPDVKQIADSLREHLPDYMIPVAIIQMDAFPLSPNGKVNRKAFPAPEQADMDIYDTYTAPRTPEEELVAGIWADILNLEKVGVTSSFFDLGGHSLLATQVISRIKDAFDVELQLRHLFETPTVEKITQEIDKILKADSLSSAPPIEKADRQQEIPLSFAQQRLWFLDQLAPGSSSYNIPSALRLNGALDVSALEKSMAAIISRHESLRTTFSDVEGKPVQIISEPEEFELDVIDISALSEEDRESEAAKIVRKDANAPFDLSSGPLLRAGLIKLADDEHVILLNMHHIISDGWSVGILINEVIQLYLAFSSGKPSLLTDMEIQYADFAVWQQNWLSGEVLENQINYWKNQLAGAPPLLELPTDRPRPAMQTFNGAKESFQLSEELTRALSKLNRREGVTSFMSLLAAFQVLLHRYSRQEQILTGSPLAGRTNSKIEKLIGFFVNTLIFKADFSENLTFEELLHQVRETALSAYAHQDLPFEKLVEELHPQRDMSHSPIFQTAFVLQNMPGGNIVELPGLTMRSMESGTANAKYDLTLTMMDAGEKMAGSLEYNTDLFDKETIERMLNHFRIILEAMTADSETEIASVSLLSPSETQQLLIDWNKTEEAFPDNKLVHELFEEIAEKQPHAPALTYKKDAASEADELTYRQLNEKANQTARYLIQNGAGPEQVVGICMERSVNMAAAMLAVLKSGSAYVPVDPSYPQDRIEYMVKDSGIKLILTQDSLKTQLNSQPAVLISMDGDKQKIEQESRSNPAVPMHPENLAYVIYTSGSTGKPKGTLLHHRGACSLVHLQQKAFNTGPGSRILQFASLSFDAATWEFLMTLLSGSAFVLTSAQTITAGQELVNLLADQKITTITLPPSVLAVLPETELPDLKTIITAGEAVSAELVNTWMNGRRFFNAYGPTETTVCASMYECRGTYTSGPPIGKANPNFKLYILDEQNQPVPLGVPGELCVSGAGAARGYHNQPALSAEKFIPNPFSSKPGDRLYRTGDLVRYLPDGNIEFIGRIDHQVKIRGFRIELGEIEAVLSQHESITDVIVLAREDKPGDKRLAAYIVTNNEVELDSNLLKSYLREHLPDYMTPSAFVQMPALPLTPNGKIDRRALPAPEITRDDLSAEYEAPRNEAEEKLTAIVSELLNVEKVGIHDNFFELGGHSLLATQFMSRLKSAFDVELPLRILFEKPTTMQIAEEIEKAKQAGPAAPSGTPKIKRAERRGRTMKRSDLED